MMCCSKPGGVKGLSNELMQLRKICQHPFLFESVEDKVNPGSMIDDKLIRSSGKIELLNRISRPSWYIPTCVALWGMTSALTGVKSRVFFVLPSCATDHRDVPGH